MGSGGWNFKRGFDLTTSVQRSANYRKAERLQSEQEGLCSSEVAVVRVSNSRGSSASDGGFSGFLPSFQGHVGGRTSLRTLTQIFRILGRTGTSGRPGQANNLLPLLQTFSAWDRTGESF